MFTDRDPRGMASELRARGETDVVGEYLIGKESYELFLPGDAIAGQSHGLLVWINSGPSGALPDAQWRRVLAAHQLVWAGPNRVGNDREVALRVGLALDAVRAAGQRFTLDRERVYVGGFSGGAKSAFRALLYYPDVFRGALLASGVEYYRALPVHSRPQGGTWPARFGTPRDLALTKTRPVALTTGPNDFNFGQISDVVSGMLEDRFTRVQIFSWQDLGHSPPPADALDRALTWLDGR
jgi:predicted esterase